jgi:hypothetical protein
MRLNLGPNSLSKLEAGPWWPVYALWPTRVENSLVWFEKYYVRLVPVRDYHSNISKTSECQWTYKMEPEYRLAENIDKEY